MRPSDPALSTRLPVIGNSGSGKSTLAECVASHTSQPVFDLDLIHWLEGGPRRDEDIAKSLVAGIAGRPSWIIEGVYGWLAAAALERATALTWRDLTWPDCRDSPHHKPYPGVVVSIASVTVRTPTPRFSGSSRRCRFAAFASWARPSPS